MNYRNLRLAWSVAYGLACVMLLAIAVRSYFWLDHVSVGRNSVASLNGRLLQNDVFNLTTTETHLMGTISQHQFAGGRISTWSARRGALIPVGVGKSYPIWPLFIATATLTGLPWLSSRFSLRTLLIAITIIALLLGAVTMLFVS